MPKAAENPVSFPQEPSSSRLDEIPCDGAREKPGRAIEDEVSAYLGAREHPVDESGRRLVVRSGHLPERSIQTPKDEIPIKQPPGADRRDADERARFQSSVLPPHLPTSNPIEVTIASVRLRTAETRGCRSPVARLSMVFNLALSARKRWRTLNGARLFADVIEGVVFEDGVKRTAA